jgi:transposase-like protein
VNSPDLGNAAADQFRATVAVTIPPACPACQSRSITTTARNPDEHTYWRCGSCGEIWNASRREARQSGVHTWAR